MDRLAFAKGGFDGLKGLDSGSNSGHGLAGPSSSCLSRNTKTQGPKALSSSSGCRTSESQTASYELDGHKGMKRISVSGTLASRYLGVLFFAARLPFAYAAEFSDDSTNDLFSDLGPLLSLFGEQVAKQFMASSTTWEDNILFAVGPLGIMTAIVSAIRIGGPLWLRTIIGRARESRAVAEEELTSSTSEDVCEIWNGTSVVRLVGSPRILQIVYLEDPSISQPEDRLLTLENGTKAGYRFQLATKKENPSTIHFLAKNASPRDDEEARRSPKIRRKSPQIVAPNLFLNLRPKLSIGDRWEQRAFVLLGIILQAGVLAFTGPTVYHSNLKHRFKKDDELLEPQSFPLAAVGTVLLVFGMWICSIVVESSTMEQIWEVLDPTATGRSRQLKSFRVIWLQQAGTVTDQQFDSYAIVARKARNGIITRRLVSSVAREESSLATTTTPPSASTPIGGKRQALHVHQISNGHQRSCTGSSGRKDSDPSTILQTATTFGTAISVVGFVLQFTGFRSMHYSAAVAQLVVTATMVIVRAYIRRGLALQPTAYKIPESYEMEWVSTRLAFEPDKLWLSDSEKMPRFARIRSFFATSDTTTGTTTSCRTGSDQCNCLIFDGECNNWSIVSGKSTESFLFHEAPLSHLSGCHRAMKIRERIGQISKWTGSVSEAAVALSTAIEVVMNSLFDDNTLTDMAWTMQGCKSPTAPDDSGLVYLTVQRRKGTWKASATEIDAVLSLWLFSIHSQRGELSKDLDHEEQGDWLRQGSNAIRSPAIRLLGTETIHSPYFRELTWYLGEMLQEVRALQPSGVSNSTSGQTVTIEPQLLLGFEKLEGPVSPSPNVARTFNLLPLEYRESYFEPFRWAHESSDANTKPTASPLSLGLFSEASIERHLVQDMFSSFIWAVARKMDRMKGKTVVVSGTKSADQTVNGGDWRYFQLQNDQISKLANDIEGVAGDWLGGNDGILFSLIPQLSLSDKLPTPLAIIDYVREISLPFENVGNWRKAVEIHLFLFECCEKFQPGSELRKKVISVLVNLCSRIGELRLEREQFGVDDDLIEEARAGEAKLVSALAAFEVAIGGDGLVRKMAILYRAQNRPLLALEDRVRSLGFDIPDCPKQFFGFKGATPLHENCLKKLLPDSDDWRQCEASDLCAQDELGLTWLHYFLLVKRSSQEYVTGLYVLRRSLKEYFGNSYKFDPKLVDISGWSVVHYLVSSENLTSHGSFLEFLGLDRPVRNTVDYGFGQDLMGRTPFHLVRSEDVARLFAAVAGAALGILDRDESDALMVITRRGFTRAASLLLDFGGNSRSTDGSRRSVLHWAAYHGDDELLKKLKQKGADLNEKDGMERTPLLWTRASQALLDCWEELVPQIEHLGSKDVNGRTVLHLGALAGTVTTQALINLTFQNTQILNAEDNFALTPLSLAASKGRKQTVRPLLDAIQMQGYKSPHGRTVRINDATEEAFDGIVMNQFKDCSMEMDDDLSEGQKEDDTYLVQPFKLAVENGHDEVVRLLLNRGDLEPPEFSSQLEVTDTGAISNATKHGQQSIVKILFNRWPRSLATSEDCTEAVRLAITSGNEPMALLLLRRGCRFERDYAVQYCGSAYLLTEACHRGMYDTVRLLLDLGSEIDAVEADATTGIWLPDPRDTAAFPLDHSALYVAAMSGQLDIAELLLDRGALVNLEGPDGRTPLYAAVANKHEPLVRLLLSRGARAGTRRTATITDLEPTDAIKALFEKYGASYALAEPPKAAGKPTVEVDAKKIALFWALGGGGGIRRLTYYRRPVQGRWTVDGRWDGEVREFGGVGYVKRGCL